MVTKTCYMCENLGITNEHAPPKCFFAKGHRKELITVPSCELHNNKNSDDVEFLRFLLVLSSSGYSNAAHRIFKNAILRDVRRKPNKYQQYHIDKYNFKNKNLIGTRIDRQRFDYSYNCIIKALYYHSFGKKHKLQFDVFSPNLYGFIGESLVGYDENHKKIFNSFRESMHNLKVEGFNPKIFKYKFQQVGEMTYFAAQFYDFFEVFAVTTIQVD